MVRACVDDTDGNTNTLYFRPELVFMGVLTTVCFTPLSYCAASNANTLSQPEMLYVGPLSVCLLYRLPP